MDGAQQPSKVRTEVQGKIGIITLNDPATLNAAGMELMDGLTSAFDAFVADPAVRAIVITGEGRGFCSGGDVEEIIGELVKREAAELREFTRMTGAVVKGLRELPMPVIAGVNGVAAGAGSVIALAADFRLLAQSASFAFLFTRVGLSGADMGSAYLLPRIVGLGRATELLMLGDRIDAARALEIGLANEVVPDEELRDRVAALARRLADGPALAYSATKAALIRELDSDLGTSIEMEALTQALLMKSEDFNEFYNAWHEGRKPDWRGR